jgi:hypothetical protein
MNRSHISRTLSSFVVIATACSDIEPRMTGYQPDTLMRFNPRMDASEKCGAWDQLVKTTKTAFAAAEQGRRVGRPSTDTPASPETPLANCTLRNTQNRAGKHVLNFECTLTTRLPIPGSTSQCSYIYKGDMWQRFPNGVISAEYAFVAVDYFQANCGGDDEDSQSAVHPDEFERLLKTNIAEMCHK